MGANKNNNTNVNNIQHTANVRAENNKKANGPNQEGTKIKINIDEMILG